MYWSFVPDSALRSPSAGIHTLGIAKSVSNHCGLNSKIDEVGGLRNSMAELVHGRRRHNITNKFPDYFSKLSQQAFKVQAPRFVAPSTSRLRPTYKEDCVLDCMFKFSDGVKWLT